jgi:hypothetical protein
MTLSVRHSEEPFQGDEESVTHFETTPFFNT